MINRLKKLSPQFKKILKVSSTVANSYGFKIYLVGGVVRDLLLEGGIFDLDIVVEGDAIKFAKELSRKLGAEFQKHHVFGTATVCFDGYKIDFATARTEKYTHWGALPKVKPATLTQDLLRRDFTINAMAISLNKDDYGKLIDLFDGLGDLKKGLIRVLHPNSFLDDPTRILRAIRFEQRFCFKIEKETSVLMKDALAESIFRRISPHRLRDEIVLILKEPKPYRYIKRIKEMIGFSFVDKRIRLNKERLKFFLKVERTTLRYQKKFKKHKTPQVWLIYLAGILIGLPRARIRKVFGDFAFKKGERAIVLSIKEGIKEIKKLSKRKKPHIIYRILEPYSYESILFFYAYYSNKTLRSNIEYFLDKLVKVQLEVKGRDLKKLGFRPLVLYNKILQKLLYVKLDNNLRGKREEIKQAKLIFKKLS